MSLVPSRRFLMGAAAGAVLARPSFAFAKSAAATRGAAPFNTADVIPGDDIDLGALDMTSKARAVVALTFDDGPDHAGDTAILDILKVRRVSATFLTIGSKIHAAPNIVERALAEGHEIGNHSWSHPMLTEIPPDRVLPELTEANAALAELGVKPVWFRPPFGDFDERTVEAARAAGLRTVTWTLDTRDWKEGVDKATIEARVPKLMKPGSIMLMHSTRSASTQALNTLIDAGERAGLRFVTLSGWRAAMAGTR